MQAIELSQRMLRVKPSATLAVSAKAAALRAKGLDIINLSVGEPDFDTPEHIKEAAIKALHDGFTKYTPVDGIPELKQAIIAKLEKDNNLQYEPNEIVVTCGAKQAIYNLLQVFINAGDEVIIPAPYWVSYPEMVELADGKPVIITTNMTNKLKINADQLQQAITPRTKLLILNSPSNPTGLIYSADELKKLAQVLVLNPHVFILTDDIYEYIRFDTSEPFVNIVSVCPELKSRTIVVNGASKAYSMTGWRLGYADGPAKLIRAMSDVQSQSTSNPNSITQKAVVAALTGDQSCVATMVKSFKQRHSMVYQHLNEMAGVNVLPADGTFYTFPNFSKIMQGQFNMTDDVAFAELLLEKAHLALVPGSAFGAPGHLRFSFATSDALLEKALQRLSATLAR